MARITCQEATEPDPRRSITPAGFALTTGVRINTISAAHDCDIDDVSPRALIVYGVFWIYHVYGMQAQKDTHFFNTL